MPLTGYSCYKQHGHKSVTYSQDYNVDKWHRDGIFSGINNINFISTYALRAQRVHQERLRLKLQEQQRQVWQQH